MEENGRNTEKTELFCQALARRGIADLAQNMCFLGIWFLKVRHGSYNLSMIFGIYREQFESMAQLNNSVKQYGITEEEEMITESTHLVVDADTLLRQICETDKEDKLPPDRDQVLMILHMM